MKFTFIVLVCFIFSSLAFAKTSNHALFQNCSNKGGKSCVELEDRCNDRDGDACFNLGKVRVVQGDKTEIEAIERRGCRYGSLEACEIVKKADAMTAQQDDAFLSKMGGK